MKRRVGLVMMVALGLAVTRVTRADDVPATNSTALNLASKGDQYVSVQSRGRIVEIESDKSVATLTPNVWHVVYYDPDSPMHRIEVKFGNGQEIDVSHPMHPFQLPANGNKLVDKDRVKVDSDQALNTATSQPLVKSLALRASKLKLTEEDYGPVWKVQLWASKLNDPTRDADVGTVMISATDGTVVKSDLHPGKTQ